MLNQIWTDDDYVYAATSSGLDIIEIESEQRYAYITYGGGFTTTWADSTKVYLGTTASGVKYINKTCISGSIVSPYELSICLTDYLNTPDILSDQIIYIHGNGGYLAISTASGIDAKGPSVSGYTYVGLASKVFATSLGEVYYITGSGTNKQVNVVDEINGYWSEPDTIYTTNSFILGNVDLFDMFVTEGTSDTGVSNTLFLATSSGVYIIDEELYTSNIYYTT